MEWWKELGYEENPFDIKPNPNLVGLEKEEKKIIKSIVSGIPIHVYGEVGTGKTSLAKRLEKVLSEKFITIYLNGEENPEPNIIEIIKKRKRKFFFFEDKRPIVLFLDECQSFTERFMRVIKYLFDEGVIHSFVTFQIERHLKNVPDSLRDRFAIESVELKPPSKEVIKEIIKMRTEGKIEIDEKGLDLIIKMNKNNVRGVLKTLSYIFSKVGPKKKLTYEEILENIPAEQICEEGEIKLSNQQIEIAKALLEGPKTIKDLEKELNIRKETIAKQLSRMLEKGYLIKRREGRKVYYELKEFVKKKLISE